VTRSNAASWHPDSAPPSEKDYVQQLSISRDSVSRAMGVLRNEGLITTGRPGSYVREQLKREAVRIAQGTISERRQLGIDERMPVLVVKRPAQPDETHPADQAVIEMGEGWK
jgi:DNA-binding GntR family transcriptional regulator